MVGDTDETIIGEESENYFHLHARMTVDLCLTIDANKVNANVFSSALFDNMPEATTHAYQQLWRAMLADPETRRRLLSTLLLEKSFDLYYNEDDILTDLAEEENLVNDDGGRIEIADLALDHLVDGAPYFFWKDKEATEATFLAEEGRGGLDVHGFQLNHLSTRVS